MIVCVYIWMRSVSEVVDANSMTELLVPVYVHVCVCVVCYTHTHTCMSVCIHVHEVSEWWNLIA